MTPIKNLQESFKYHFTEEDIELYKQYFPMESLNLKKHIPNMFNEVKTSFNEFLTYIEEQYVIQYFNLFNSDNEDSNQLKINDFVKERMNNYVLYFSYLNEKKLPIFDSFEHLNDLHYESVYWSKCYYGEEYAIHKNIKSLFYGKIIEQINLQLSNEQFFSYTEHLSSSENHQSFIPKHLPHLSFSMYLIEAYSYFLNHSTKEEVILNKGIEVLQNMTQHFTSIDNSLPLSIQERLYNTFKNGSDELYQKAQQFFPDMLDLDFITDEKFSTTELYFSNNKLARYFSIPEQDYEKIRLALSRFSIILSEFKHYFQEVYPQYNIHSTNRTYDKDIHKISLSFFNEEDNELLTPLIKNFAKDYLSACLENANVYISQNKEIELIQTKFLEYRLENGIKSKDNSQKRKKI